MSGDKRIIAEHFVKAKWRFRHLRGERLQEYQMQRANAVIHYAVQHAPFYRDHWQGQNLNDWQNLPPVEKSAMMARFAEFNTIGISREEGLEFALRAEQTRDFAPTWKGGYAVGLSSGTSGRRGLFVVSKWEQAAWAGAILARALPRLRARGFRVALFLRSNSTLYERVGSRFLAFRYFDLLTPLEESIPHLNAYQPDILVGPPSLLQALGAQQRAGKLRIRPVKVISAAEVLEEGDRQELETAFDAPIGQIYQATEGLIGVTCAQGSLHVQEDVMAVQTVVLDPEKPQYVTPILTDLWRTTQPILRYQLNDVWKMQSAPCRCRSEFRVIEQVLGRRDDILYFPALTASGERRPVFPDLIYSIVGLASPQLRDYQAFQEEDGHLRLHLAVEASDFEKVAEDTRRSAARQLEQEGCRCLRLVIEQGLEPVAPGVKRQRVRNLAEAVGSRQ